MSWPSLPVTESGGNEERKGRKMNPLPAYLIGMLIYAVVWTPTALLVSGISGALSNRTWSGMSDYVFMGGVAVICIPPINIVWATWIAVFGSLQFFFSRSAFMNISWLDPEEPVRRSLVVGLALGALQAGVAVPVAFALGLDPSGPDYDTQYPLAREWVGLLLNYGLAGFAGSVACGYILGLFLRKIRPAVEASS